MSKPCVLVIDDDNTIISVVDALLTKNNFSIITATNGNSGLQMAKTHMPKAIILDKQMPEMSGDEILKWLKADAKTKDIPVLMLTAQNNVDEISSSLEHGACDYIVKPFDHDNLIVRLRNALRK